MRKITQWISYLFIFMTQVSFGQDSKGIPIGIKGFIETSGFSQDTASKRNFGLEYSDYLLTTTNGQYLIESPIDVSSYYGEYCEIYGEKIGYADNRWIFSCSVFNVDSIRRVDYLPDYTKQDSLIEAKKKFMNDLWRNCQIDTIQGVLIRTIRYAPDLMNDYAIRIDTPIKYTGGETDKEYEMISQFTIHYLDLNMLYDFEHHIKNGQRIRVIGFLKSGYGDALTMTTLKIIE